jgi:Glutathione S-transferase, N-terminal domain
MKLYVCWGTFRTDRGHPCGDAYKALHDAGHDPKVAKTGGCFRTDPLFPGRREVKRMTGNYKVPTLVLDDGSIIDGTANIIKWAKTNPGPGRDAGATDEL